MTLGQLLAAAYSDLGYATSPPSDISTRLTRYINEGYTGVLRLPGMERLRFSTLTASSVASQKQLILGPAIERIERIVDSTQNVALRQMTRDEFRKIDPQELTSGTPYQWIDDGYHPVMRQPINSGVWAVSDQAADTQTITGSVIDASNTVFPINTTLHGTTPTLLCPITTLASVTAINLGSAAVGNITITDGIAAPGPNTLAIFRPTNTTVLYRAVRLWPTPSQSAPYHVDCIIPITPMVGLGDVPFLPVDFHPMLNEYARVREYERRDDGRAQQALMFYTDSLKRLKERVWNMPDYRPAMMPLGVNGTPSNLGSWYPSKGGRW